MCAPPITLDDAICLPPPADGSSQYTKPEAAEILRSQTKKGTKYRTQVMDKMIDLGLTPTSKRTLRRLVGELEAGKVIKNGPWDSTRAKVRDSPTGTRCNGIQ